MSVLRCDVPLDIGPGELQQGAWDATVRVLFDQLAFRTAPSSTRRWGRARGIRRGATLDVEVDVQRLGDRACSSRSVRRLPCAEAVWDGCRSSVRCGRWRSRVRIGRYLDGPC
jgi:hypothetical protein